METGLSFGLWVQKRRKALDLTRDELAAKVGSSTSALRKIEGDERRPSKQLAELLAQALLLSEDEKASFVRIARGESSVERLRAQSAAPLLGLLEVPLSLPKPIPIPATPLIGRETELSALRQLLEDSQCRLITLLGPGGSGKTRLAIQVASEVREAEPGTACFVPLAGVRSPEYLVPSIAEALQFSFAGSLDPREQLLIHLESRALLLVLDNFEQLLVAADLLVDFLERARGVKVLVTSRERLNLQGEWVFEVQGLESPENGAEQVLSYSAPALFVQSAHRVSSSFTLTSDEGPVVARICNLVQGMPLGIELAATWVRTLSCLEIAQEVERNLDFLAVPMQGMPDRHRSMRAVFDHSWNLLSEAEQRTLHQLSVFRSGFQREAAREVAGADLPLLSALLDKSLIRRLSSGRFEIHELLRQYAESKGPERPGELGAARHRHSSYYADLVLRLHAELISARQKDALAETSTEMDNIRAAWQLAVESKAVNDIHKFIRGLWQFYEIRGWFKEGEMTFRLAIEKIKNWPGSGEEAGPGIVGLQEYLRAHYTWFSMRLGHWGEAGRLVQDSVTQLRSLEAWPELAAVLHMAGVALWGTGRYAEARDLMQEKIALETQFGNPWDLAMGWGQMGLAVQGLGDYYTARDCMARADKLIRQCGDTRMMAVSLYHRAGVEYDLGELETAREMLAHSLELSTAVGDRWIMSTSRLQLGLIAQTQGDHEEAVHWFLESMGFFRETGEYRSKVQASTALGTSLIALGDSQAAGQALHEALAEAMAAELWPETIATLAGFANLQEQQGDDEAALATLEQATRHPACSQATRDRTRKLRSEVQARLTAQQVQDVLLRAQAEPFDRFVRRLLEASQ